MKKLAFGALFFAGLVACGGNKAKPDTIVIGDDDGSGSGSNMACDPLAQTGCNTGEKCTWIWDERDASGELGHIGCVMDGTVAPDQACTFNMDPIGFDNCTKGSFCLDGVCKEICDNNGGAPMCPSDKSCGYYYGVFGAAGQPVAAGLCDPKCDPLSQVRLTDNAPACGSTDVQNGVGSNGSNAPEEGCYTADFIDFTCASTPEGRGSTTDFSDRQACTAPDCAFDSTHFYTNGCDPGFVSFFFDSTGSSQVDCTRLCAPLDTDVTKPANGVGDPAVLGKLPTDAAPVAQHATCKVNQGAKETNEECRFLWLFLIDPNTGMPSTSTYNDTLGVCFHFPSFMYDPTGGTNATKIEPACSSLRAGSGSDITGPNNVACSNAGSGSEADCFAVFHGCYTLEESGFKSTKTGKNELVNGKELGGRYHAFLGDKSQMRRLGGIH